MTRDELKSRFRQWEAATKSDIYWATRDPHSSTSVPTIDAALDSLTGLIEEYLEDTNDD